MDEGDALSLSQASSSTVYESNGPKRQVFRCYVGERRGGQKNNIQEVSLASQRLLQEENIQTSMTICCVGDDRKWTILYGAVHWPNVFVYNLFWNGCEIVFNYVQHTGTRRIIEKYRSYYWCSICTQSNINCLWKPIYATWNESLIWCILQKQFTWINKSNQGVLKQLQCHVSWTQSNLYSIDSVTSRVAQIL